MKDFFRKEILYGVIVGFSLYGCGRTIEDDIWDIGKERREYKTRRELDDDPFQETPKEQLREFMRDWWNGRRGFR